MQISASSKSSLPVDLFFTIFSFVVIYSASPWILDQFHQALSLLGSLQHELSKMVSESLYLS